MSYLQKFAVVAGLSFFLDAALMAQEKENKVRPALVLEANEKPIWCIAFSPDGKLIAGGGGGYLGTAGELRVWGPQNPQGLGGSYRKSIGAMGGLFSRWKAHGYSRT